MTNGITQIGKYILREKLQEKNDKIEKNYTLIILIGIIGNSNYIGTSLSGSIQ